MLNYGQHFKTTNVHMCMAMFKIMFVIEGMYNKII